MIVLDKITKSFGEKKIFENFSLTLNEGEITVVLGESGVGKTTLLKILSNTTPYSGICSGISSVSSVFQEDRLLPFKTVNANLEFVLGKGYYSEALESVGLKGEGNRYPGELSGGMARRVALLRAFLYKSDLMIMDEPFASLDISVKYKLMNLFLKMWEKDKRTTVMVTHNVDEAVYMGGRVLVLGEKGSILLDEKVNEKTREKIISLFTEEQGII